MFYQLHVTVSHIIDRLAQLYTLSLKLKPIVM